jgi:NitT/TauT family transport system ATP-binding protein
MRQRVNLARALVTDAPVVLMDEPFSGLDYLTRHAMQDLTSTLVEKDRAVVFVTHDLEEAVFLSDRIIVMSPEEKTVIAQVEVPGGRPRLPELRRSSRFQAMVADLQDLVVTGNSSLGDGNV